MRFFRALSVMLVLLGFGTVSCSAELVELPEIGRQEGLTVAEAIYRRRSVRTYSDEPLTLSDVAHLLWAAGGKTVDGLTGPTRAYPSAGGVYPLEVYLVSGNVEGLEAGIYLYDWRGHSLEIVREGDFRADLSRAALGQNMPRTAPCSIVITADFRKTVSRYGRRGEELYVPIDTGHMAQNVNLQAESLGMSCVMIGAFDESAVDEVLGGVRGRPVYVIPVGRP